MLSLSSRRAQISQLAGERRRKLDDSLLYSQFNRDHSEAQGWIDDRLKQVTDQSFSQVADLHDKMRMLQKHQAFEAEIMANAQRIKNIKEVRAHFCWKTSLKGLTLSALTRYFASDGQTQQNCKWKEYEHSAPMNIKQNWGFIKLIAK